MNGAGGASPALLVGLLAAAALSAATSCGVRSRGEAPPLPTLSQEDTQEAARLAALRGFLQSRTTGGSKDGSGSLGDDPWAVVPLDARDDAKGYVGVLRGASAVVLLAADLEERARADGPLFADALAVGATGSVYVAGDGGGEVRRYEVERAASGVTLAPKESVKPVSATEQSYSLRDLAFSGGRLFALDALEGRIFSIPVDRGGRLGAMSHVADVAPNSVGLAVTAHAVVVNELATQSLVFFARAPDGGLPSVSRIHHDGPFWGVAAVEDAHGVVTAVAGGVEDHPLDRREGSFGYVDSFVTAARWGGGEAHEIATVNTSELGVVVPKTPALTVHDGSIEATFAGAGSAKAVTLRLSKDGRFEARSLQPVTPGVRGLEASGASFVGANPLADVWVKRDPAGAFTERATSPSDGRPFSARLGEALVFTTLMAPWGKSDGRLSRFTCETCHFEGQGDGRVHFTGREGGPSGHDKIFATTKPLFGLGNNAPHFTRALDPDLASVAMNEFRVAGAKSDHDPWFSIDVARDAPWLRSFGAHDATDETLTPERLREAFVVFLAEYQHRPNPRVLGRTEFTEREARGAAVFQAVCEACHQARSRANDPASRVPFAEWRSRVFSGSADLVWARDGFEKTGVLPYVNDLGARTSSLRRIARKSPYFTNGSAKDLSAVIAAARAGDGRFLHADDGDPRLKELPMEDREPLLFFLSLL